MSNYPVRMCYWSHKDVALARQFGGFRKEMTVYTLPVINDRTCVLHIAVRPSTRLRLINKQSRRANTIQYK